MTTEPKKKVPTQAEAQDRLATAVERIADGVEALMAILKPQTPPDPWTEPAEPKDYSKPQPEFMGPHYDAHPGFDHEDCCK